MQPNELTDAIGTALSCLGLERSEAAAPERIAGGLSSESWLVKAADRALVVRLGNRRTDGFQIDSQSEATILAQVAAAGIGAPVLLCDPERHLLVTQCLPGRVWSARDARVPENIERLARLLRDLHSMPIPAQARNVDLWKAVHRFWNALMACGLGGRVGSPAVRERARRYIAELREDAQVCLCHNNLHHLNVIDDGRLRLVNWEYAGVGDPYVDLATFCCYHAFSDAARRALLRAYFGYEQRSSYERLQRMCWTFNYIRDLWFGMREMEE